MCRIIGRRKSANGGGEGLEGIKKDTQVCSFCNKLCEVAWNLRSVLELEDIKSV